MSVYPGLLGDTPSEDRSALALEVATSISPVCLVCDLGLRIFSAMNIVPVTENEYVRLAPDWLESYSI